MYQYNDTVKENEAANIDYNPIKFDDGGGGGSGIDYSILIADSGIKTNDGGAAYTPPIVADDSNQYGNVDLTQLNSYNGGTVLPVDPKPMYNDSPPQLVTTNDGGGTQAVIPPAQSAGTNWPLILGLGLAAYFLFFNKSK